MAALNKPGHGSHPNKMIPERYNPLKLSGTDLPPHLLFIVKLLTLALIGKGYLETLPQPFLPFILPLDEVSGVWFQTILKVAFIISAALLFTNQKVRLSCFILGSVFLIGTLSSKIYYSNAKVFCGLVYIMIGLSASKGRPWLLHLQLLIVYFASGINKVFDVDWITGQYFDHWMVHVIHARSYEFLADLFSHEFVSKALSWQTIIIEIVILPVALVFRKWQPIGVWIGIAFHTFAFWMSGLSFGVFYPAAMISYLSFASDIPKVYVYGSDGNFLAGILKNTLQVFDRDGRYFFPKNQNGDNPEGVIIDLRKEKGWINTLNQWRLLLIYHPLTYIVLVIFLGVNFLPNIFQHIAALACLILFFPIYGAKRQFSEKDR